MPLRESKKVDGGAIALWQVTETEEQLHQLANGVVCPDEIKSANKKLEWLAGRILVRQLAEQAGLTYEGIRKDEYGKPFLINNFYHISLSHSYPFIAAQIHPSHPVGIDVEQPTSKLLKIAHRILDMDEERDAGENIVKHCIYWCAKEALYKVYGRRGLLFNHHLKVNAFTLEQEGDIVGMIESNGAKETKQLHYIVYPDFVLVYSKT